jgi:hypothetical protein
VPDPLVIDESNCTNEVATVKVSMENTWSLFPLNEFDMGSVTESSQDQDTVATITIKAK